MLLHVDVSQIYAGVQDYVSYQTFLQQKTCNEIFINMSWNSLIPLETLMHSFLFYKNIFIRT